MMDVDGRGVTDVICGLDIAGEDGERPASKW
jgi:hypothetical protein